MSKLFSQKELIDILLKEGDYKNRHSVPYIKKVVLNRGVGEARENSKAIDVSAQELAEISGQKPLVINSKKAIASFKLKKDTPIGLKVTLRGRRMYDFLNKLINICLPKIRDFSGLSPKSFDGKGNYNFGLKEQLIFPEVDYEKIDRLRGMDVTIVTSAQDNKEARKLLEALGLPFRKDAQ